MFSFRSLGSGSCGNSYFFTTDEGHFLIDAGVGIRKLKRYLYDSGVKIGQLDALFLTHDHCDHAKNAGALQQDALKQGHTLPLYATELVVSGILSNYTITKKPVMDAVSFLTYGQTVKCCGAELTTFQVPHDSCDNIGFFISYQGHSICLVTDVGKLTPTILDFIGQTNQLILEANYDETLLEAGPYPLYLQHRISSGYGHLSNTLAAQVILEHRSHLDSVWLCHLSENNNTPSRAHQVVEDTFKKENLIVSDFLRLETLPRKSASFIYIL